MIQANSTDLESGGRRSTQTPIAEIQVIERAKAKKKRTMVAGVIGVIVVIAALVLLPVLLMKYKKKNDNDSNEEFERIYKASERDIDFGEYDATLHNKTLSAMKFTSHDIADTHSHFTLKPAEKYVTSEGEIDQGAMMQHAKALLKEMEKSELRLATSESATAEMVFNTLYEANSHFGLKLDHLLRGGHAVYDTDAKRQFVDLAVADVYTHKCAAEMCAGLMKLAPYNKMNLLTLTVTGHAGPEYLPPDRSEWVESVNHLGSFHLGVGIRNKSDHKIDTYAVHFNSDVDTLSETMKNIDVYKKAVADSAKEASGWPPNEVSVNVEKARNMLRRQVTWAIIELALKTLDNSHVSNSTDYELDAKYDSEYRKQRDELMIKGAIPFLKELRKNQINVITVESATGGLMASVAVDVVQTHEEPPTYGMFGPNVYGGHSFILQSDVPFIDGKWSDFNNLKNTNNNNNNNNNTEKKKNCEDKSAHLAQEALRTGRAVSSVANAPCENGKVAVTVLVSTPAYRTKSVATKTLETKGKSRFEVTREMFEFAREKIAQFCDPSQESGGDCKNYRGITYPEFYDEQDEYGPSWIIRRAATQRAFPAQLPDLYLQHDASVNADDLVTCSRKSEETKGEVTIFSMRFGWMTRKAHVSYISKCEEKKITDGVFIVKRITAVEGGDPTARTRRVQKDAVYRVSFDKPDDSKIPNAYRMEFYVKRLSEPEAQVVSKEFDDDTNPATPVTLVQTFTENTKRYKWITNDLCESGGGFAYELETMTKTKQYIMFCATGRALLAGGSPLTPLDLSS